MSPATRGYNLADDVTALAQLYAPYSPRVRSVNQ